MHALHAFEETVRRGSSFGAPTELETELAELIVDAVPSIEMVRFVSSGTEAAMSAIRLARGFTGRDVIVKFAGCYHGHVDSLLVQAGSSATTLGVPTSPGVPHGCTSDTVVLRYNDAQALADTFRDNGDHIAAVILEPVVGNMGVVEAKPEFLKIMRRTVAVESGRDIRKFHALPGSVSIYPTKRQPYDPPRGIRNGVAQASPHGLQLRAERTQQLGDAALGLVQQDE